jgi:phospholipase C
MATKPGAKNAAKQVAAPLGADSAQQNLQKIDHFVILMMENRSFDHVLGYLSLPGGRTDVDGLTGTESNAYRPTPNGAPVSVKVHHLASTALGANQDPCHKGHCVDDQTANGNAGFMQNYFATHPGDPDPGVVMGYYNATDVPVYDFLAKEFAISDSYFSSVKGETWPNRLYMTSGKAAGSRDNTFVPLYENKSWVRQLDALNISWKGYGNGFPGHCSIRFSDWNYRSSPNFEPFDGTYGFIRDAATGALPAVSVIDPVFFKNDDHPPGDIALGQVLVARVYNALANSPAWSRTLLLVVYDEHGGLFDHVPPGPAVDDDPNFKTYGVRVPAFFVGPYVPKGKCFHTTLDHASIVKTILLRFCASNGTIPNLGARVAAAAHFGEVLSEAVARTGKPVPTPTVQKIATTHAALAFAEFKEMPEVRPHTEDEAGFIRAAKQLQEDGGKNGAAAKRSVSTKAAAKSAKANPKSRKTAKPRQAFVPRGSK